ncbi:MAG: hypothetical protein J6C22_11410, partial [Bacteroides sp.]|nr:hypothetical protein [Bacteroides sp.]
SMPDKKWTKEDFRNLTKEGKKAFDSAWKELKDFGYLKVHFMPDNGKWQTEYELLDEPDLGPHTLYHNSEGEVSSDNLTRAEKKRQTQTITDENSSLQSDSVDEDTEIGDSDRYPPFGSNGNGSNAYGSNANGGNNNKDYNINPDINPNIINPNHNQYQEQDVMGEEYSMEFIEYHYNLDEEFVSLHQERQINTMKDVLYDALNTQKPVIRVMGEDKPAAVVKSRLLKLDRLDIDYAIEQYKKQVTKVRNHKAYMLTVLYQAKAQSDLDISNQVMYDFYGAGRMEEVGDDNGEEERMYSGPDTASYG